MNKTTDSRTCFGNLGLKFLQSFLALKLCGKFFGRKQMEQI
jgi:hypothetical protein